MITYSAAISACGKGQKVTGLETMRDQGLLPDGITNDALLSACDKGTLPQ